MLALIELGDSDPELLDVYLTSLDERLVARATAPTPAAQPVPVGKRPLAPPASRSEIHAFFAKKGR